jgi:tetratricopeptide (TPR) repeat protein
MSAMSSTQASDDEVCASCGKEEVDNIKLRKCTACKLVKYCSVECQKNHRPQHKRACKKRAAEIRDDLLFTQNEISYLGECPICCLPLPLDESKTTLNTCCSKYICAGCSHANKTREIEQSLEHKCLYCREPIPDTEEKVDQNAMKRVKANDPVTLREVGRKQYREGEYEGAFQYWTTAAELGDMEAHYNLSCLYRNGQGVEKNEKKEIYHSEEAAIGGHPNARHNLGNHEYRNGQNNRALKHWIIAANLGDDDALDMVKQGFQVDLVSKEDYEAALRGHQVAVDATKSEQREEAYADASIRDDRAMKRCIIAAKQGDDDALQNVKKYFHLGYVSKHDYEVALRGHQASVDATKSGQRDNMGNQEED